MLPGRAQVGTVAICEKTEAEPNRKQKQNLTYFQGCLALLPFVLSGALPRLLRRLPRAPQPHPPMPVLRCARLSLSRRLSLQGLLLLRLKVVQVILIHAPLSGRKPHPACSIASPMLVSAAGLVGPGPGGQRGRREVAFVSRSSFSCSSSSSSSIVITSPNRWARTWSSL